MSADVRFGGGGCCDVPGAKVQKGKGEGQLASLEVYVYIKKYKFESMARIKDSLFPFVLEEKNEITAFNSKIRCLFL